MADSHEVPVGELLEAALTALQSAWPVMRPRQLCPFDNTAERFDSEVFSAHAYSWGDADQPWNFRWRDLRVSWYKYLGRGLSANREVSDEEVRQLLSQCMAALAESPVA